MIIRGDCDALWFDGWRGLAEHPVFTPDPRVALDSSRVARLTMEVDAVARRFVRAQFTERVAAALCASIQAEFAHMLRCGEPGITAVPTIAAWMPVNDGRIVLVYR